MRLHGVLNAPRSGSASQFFLLERLMNLHHRFQHTGACQIQLQWYARGTQRYASWQSQGERVSRADSLPSLNKGHKGGAQFSIRDPAKRIAAAALPQPRTRG